MFSFLFLMHLMSISDVLFDVDSNGHVHSIHDHFKTHSINTLDAININLGTSNDSKEIKLANDLPMQKREVHDIVNKVSRSLCLFLEDMLRIERDIIQHQIPPTQDKACKVEEELSQSRIGRKGSTKD